jgi:trimeric autotransporter adhesin
MKKLLMVVLAVSLMALPVAAQKGPGSGTRPFPPPPFVPSGTGICVQPGIIPPDATGVFVFSNQVVADTGTITDMDVSINMTHTWVGDLIFTLEHDDTGTAVTLINRPGIPVPGGAGCADDDINGGIDDEGSIALETHCDGTTPWINFFGIGGDPANSSLMAAFDGEELSGSWTMGVSDNAAGDTGTLNEWCLLPTTVPVPVELQTFSIED